MKYRVIEGTLDRVGEKVVHRGWSTSPVQLNLDRAQGGFENDHREGVLRQDLRGRTLKLCPTNAIMPGTKPLNRYNNILPSKATMVLNACLRCLTCLLKLF